MPKLKTKGSEEPKGKEVSWDVPDARFTKVEKRFRERGFESVPPPEGANPRMVANLADKSVKDIGNLMSKYAAYREYAEEEHSMAVQRYTLLKEDYEFSHAVKLKSLSGDKITEKKVIVLADQELHQKKMKLLEEEMYMNMIGDKVESYNNCLAVISREIARREQSAENKFNT